LCVARQAFDVVADDHRARGHDVEGRRRAAARAKALVEPAAEERHATRREDRRDPAVGDLGGQGHVLGPDRRQVDRQIGAAVQDGAQRLAQPRRVAAAVRDLVILAAELERLLAPENRAHDRDVLARLAERLAKGLTVPALDYLRAGHAEPEPEPAAGERIQRHRGHRRGRGRAPGHLHDRGADVHSLGAGGDPRRGRHRVGAVRLRGPDRVVAEPLGLEHAVEVAREACRA